MRCVEYPSQIDWVWLASDGLGQIAAMMTAGEGPIPESILASDAVDIEGMLLQLPVIGEGRMIFQVPDPSSFVALSQRGLFIYDWTDIYRPSVAAKEAYELVCLPSCPLRYRGLTAELKAVAAKWDGVFGDPLITVP